MDPTPAEPRFDARSVRFELAAVAVLLLGGFVFHQVWVVPGLAVVVGVGLGFGARADVFGRLFQIVAADRLKPSTDTEPAAAVRFSQLFAVAVLSVATLLFLVGPGWLAWLVALIEAGVCALHASTGVSLEAAVRDRIRGRRS